MQAAGRSPVPTTVRLRRRMRRSLYRVPHALVDPPGRLRRGLHLERRSDRRQVISIWHSWQLFELPNSTDVDRENPRHPRRHWLFSFRLASASSRTHVAALQSILLWYQAPKCPASSTWTSPFGTSLRNAPARGYRTRDHACPRTKSSGCVLCNQACHFG